VFENFPKKRQKLPEDFQKIYEFHYKENRSGKSAASGIAQRLEEWMHLKVAEDVKNSAGKKPVPTLEIGAGTLNQLAFEPFTMPYDIVEPFKSLYSGSALMHRIRKAYSDISKVPKSRKYSRITSIAVLEHVEDLPGLVAKSGLLLEKGGSFRAGIPNEGSLIWALGWNLSTGIEFRLRHGLDYGVIMRHEHLNTADEIEHVLRFFFRQVKAHYSGAGKALSLYLFFECGSPFIERCKKFS